MFIDVREFHAGLIDVHGFEENEPYLVQKGTESSTFDGQNRCFRLFLPSTQPLKYHQRSIISTGTLLGKKRPVDPK